MSDAPGSPDRHARDRHALDPSRVDLNKLRTFAAIAEAGGVSPAARQLALTRSAVSHSLASLEESLGVALFHRVRKRLVLTREGEQLRRAYGEAEARLARALDGIAAADREVRGTVRLGLLAGLSRLRLARGVERFLTAHPGAQLRLVHGAKADLVEQLVDGRLDFALSLRSDAATADRRLRASRLFGQRLVLARSRGLRLGRTDLAALAHLPLVDYFRSDPLIDRWVAHHHRPGRLGSRCVRAWVGGATELAVELCRAGIGACVLPEDLVAPHRASGELRVVRGSGTPLHDEIWLSERRNARATAAHRAFRAALLE